MGGAKRYLAHKTPPPPTELAPQPAVWRDREEIRKSKTVNPFLEETRRTLPYEIGRDLYRERMDKPPGLNWRFEWDERVSVGQRWGGGDMSS